MTGPGKESLASCSKIAIRGIVHFLIFTNTTFGKAGKERAAL
jgi:hypothetical protein